VCWKDALGNILCNEKDFAFLMPARNTILTALFESTVGVEEPGTPGVKIFPNPATDDVTISVGEIMDDLCITDITGNIVMYHTVGNSEVRVNLSSWNAGIYLVHIKTREGRTVRKMVVR
jgi:hypothetical protein